jgi:hypothetical protein
MDRDEELKLLIASQKKDAARDVGRGSYSKQKLPKVESLTERVEAAYRPPPDLGPAWSNLVSWLPTAIKIPLEVQYAAGGYKAKCLGYQAYGISQSAWSKRVKWAEESLTAIGPEWARLGRPHLDDVLARLDQPEIVRAVVEHGSTNAASKVLKLPQGRVWRTWAAASVADLMIRVVRTYRLNRRELTRGAK